MAATWNAAGNRAGPVRRMLHWATLAGLLAATVALSATPAAANDWDHRHRDRHNDWGYYDGGGYGYYYEPPRRHRHRDYYYYAPPPAYYYPPPPVYYYPPPPPRYYQPEPSFSFGLTIPIH